MTITKNKNGTWRVDISDGINPLTGIQGRHRKYDCKTKKEAIEYEAKYRLEELGEFKRKDKLSIDSLYALLKNEEIVNQLKIHKILIIESMFQNSSKMQI